MRTTLMFKQQQTRIRPFFLLSWLSVRPLPEKRASPLIHSSTRLIHKVTAGSSSPSILSSVWLPLLLFSSLLFPPLSLSLFSLSLFLSLSLSPSLSLSLPLSLSLSLSRWWNGNAARMDNGTPSLCSSSPPHVCLSFPLSFHLCLLEARARCLSSPPSSLGGWFCLPFSLSLLHPPPPPRSLSLYHTHTHKHTHCQLLPLPSPPLFLPSYLLPVSSPSPHLLSAASVI